MHYEKKFYYLNSLKDSLLQSEMVFCISVCSDVSACNQLYLNKTTCDTDVPLLLLNSECICINDLTPKHFLTNFLIKIEIRIFPKANLVEKGLYACAENDIF